MKPNDVVGRAVFILLPVMFVNTTLRLDFHWRDNDAAMTCFFLYWTIVILPAVLFACKKRIKRS